MNDKIVGRPIRLNVRSLNAKRGKDYAQMMFFGDLHLGHPQCDLALATEYLEWARKNGVYVLLMGDLLECGTTTSIGDSVYKQKLNPQEQMEEAVRLLGPLAKAGLIVGLHSGNHEQRIANSTSIDVAKMMANMLAVKYLNYACWSQFAVGSQRYSCYSQHGKSGARFKFSKLKAIADTMEWLSADMLVMGHVHSCATETALRQAVKRGQVVEENCHLVLSGLYLKWDRSYAQAANMPLTKLGSPTAKLMANRHNIAVSV